MYVHSHGKGLRKVGTGYGGTVKGHVYDSNPRFRVSLCRNEADKLQKSDKQKCLACVGDKLYYLLPQPQSLGISQLIVPPTTSITSSQSSPFGTLDNQPVSESKVPKPTDGEEEVDTRIQVAVINSFTLKVIKPP